MNVYPLAFEPDARTLLFKFHCGNKYKVSGTMNMSTGFLKKFYSHRNNVIGGRGAVFCFCFLFYETKYPCFLSAVEVKVRGRRG